MFDGPSVVRVFDGRLNSSGDSCQNGKAYVDRPIVLIGSVIVPREDPR